MNLLKNKKSALAISIIFSIALITSSLTFAQGWGPREGRRGGGYGFSEQARTERQAFRSSMYNARVDILATMTGMSQDDIKAKLAYKPMWAVMDEYQVNYTEFNKKLTAKRAELIKQAVADGKITQDHADFMLERSADGMGPGKFQGQRGSRGQMGQRAGDCPRW